MRRGLQHFDQRPQVAGGPRLTGTRVAQQQAGSAIGHEQVRPAVAAHRARFERGRPAGVQIDVQVRPDDQAVVLNCRYARGGIAAAGHDPPQAQQGDDDADSADDHGGHAQQVVHLGGKDGKHKGGDQNPDVPSDPGHDPPARQPTVEAGAGPPDREARQPDALVGLVHPPSVPESCTGE